MIATSERQAQVPAQFPAAPDASQAEGQLPDALVVERAQAGDASAFERLYCKHSRRIFGLCLRMMGNIAAAEDLTQEVFLLVFRKIRSFRGQSAFSTWLYRIAVNLVLMRLRRNPTRETSLEHAASSLGHGDPAPRQFSSVDPQLAHSLERLHLERALAQLRPSQKLAIVLHDIQGYKHSEIAVMLDWSIGNSKSHLHRARARLRKLLQPTPQPQCSAAI